MGRSDKSGRSAAASRLVFLFLVATWFPAAAAQVQPACGAKLNTDVTLRQDLDCDSDGLEIAADGVTLNCNGHEIRGGGPGSVGIRVTARTEINIRDCVIRGFPISIRATDSSLLRLFGNTLESATPGAALSARGCPSLRAEHNRFAANGFHVSIRESPDALFRDNHFDSSIRPGPGVVALTASPHGRLFENFSKNGATIALLHGSDDGIVTDNDLGARGGVEVVFSSRCQISDNRIGSQTRSSSGIGVRLLTATECEVSENTLEGLSYGILLSGNEEQLPGGDRIFRGADRNWIIGNRIRRTGFGIVVSSGSENTITQNEIDNTSLGILLQAFPESRGVGVRHATDRNRVEGNSVSHAEFAIFTIEAWENEIEGNTFARSWLGGQEIRQTGMQGLPNRYQGNVFRNNHLFGFLAWGTSPEMLANNFLSNGDHRPIPADLEPFVTILGGLRGGLVVLPYAGTIETLDDGDPVNDRLAGPRLGAPDQENRFRANADVDIYLLDTRPQNEDTLAEDNRFFGTGTTVPVRQDWFGLIRVEDERGDPVEGADIDVHDATGRRVGQFRSGMDGTAPEVADPARPQGLSASEPGGPFPTWARFTEYEVDRRGERHETTPHTIFVHAPEGNGRARHSWDQVANDPDGSQSEDGRYQVALVRLGTGCASLGDLRSALANMEVAPGLRQSLLSRVAAAERAWSRGPASGGPLCALLGGLATSPAAGIEPLDVAVLAACVRDVVRTEELLLQCDN